MEFTELTDYPLTGGTLTLWAPRPAGGPDAAGWFDDPRPLTPVHGEYCRRGVEIFDPHAADEAAPGSWLGAAFEIPLRHDPDAVAAALTAWMQRHEVFRTTVHDVDGELQRRTLADDLVVAPTVVGHLPTGSDVHAHLLRTFEALSPLQWPHCVVATVSDPADHDERFLLVFGADHSIMDAYSMLLAIGEIQDLYARALSGAPTDTTPVGSHVDFSVSDHSAALDLHTDHPAVLAWRDFLRQGGERFPGFPVPLHLGVDDDEEVVPQSGISSWVLTADDADALNAGARGRGHSMQTLVLAALAETTRRVTGSTRTRFVMPLHTRTDPAHVASVGWFVGMVPIDIDLGSVDDIDDRLAVCAREVDRRRHLAAAPFPRIAELIGSDAAPRFVVSYVDCRRIPGAQEWSRWGARTLRGAAASPDEVYLWIVRSPSGISVSARFPSTPSATEAVHRHLVELHETLTDLAVELGVDIPQDERRRTSRGDAALTPGGPR